jgi:hypothetical protein
MAWASLFGKVFISIHGAGRQCGQWNHVLLLGEWMLEWLGIMSKTQCEKRP